MNKIMAIEVPNHTWFELLSRRYFLKIGVGDDGFVQALQYNNGEMLPTEVHPHKLVEPVRMTAKLR